MVVNLSDGQSVDRRIQRRVKAGCEEPEKETRWVNQVSPCDPGVS